MSFRADGIKRRHFWICVCESVLSIGDFAIQTMNFAVVSAVADGGDYHQRLQLAELRSAVALNTDCLGVLRLTDIAQD